MSRTCVMLSVHCPSRNKEQSRGSIYKAESLKLTTMHHSGLISLKPRHNASQLPEADGGFGSSMSEDLLGMHVVWHKYVCN